VVCIPIGAAVADEDDMAAIWRPRGLGDIHIARGQLSSGPAFDRDSPELLGALDEATSIVAVLHSLDNSFIGDGLRMLVLRWVGCGKKGDCSAIWRPDGRTGAMLLPRDLPRLTATNRNYPYLV
jgi:hypothetical protein